MAKLYTKKVWVNDQTKLSAKNLNHIENGIETLAEAIEEIEGGSAIIDAHRHENKDILDQITVPFTTELKDKYDEVDDKSVVSVSEEGSSKNAVQYITIDGTEYKLAGSDIKYKDFSNVSLNSLTLSGIYSVKNALDVPEGTSTNGTLTVTKLTDDIIKQEWASTQNYAHRLYDLGDAVQNVFTVNGVAYPQGEIQLEPGATYELQGNLLGRVTIGTDSAVPTVRTKIILNGVNIQSSADYAIGYLPDAEELDVVLAPDTENYLVNSEVGEVADNDFGALHSANDLHLSGTGSLTVKNGKGHGIKGSDLIISGKPGIYVESNHDAIHGGKLLKITGGKFVINNAKDAFSSSEHAPAQDGKMLILGGTFIINSCRQAAFEGKSNLGLKRILNANITLGAGVTSPFVSPNGFEIYETTTITNNSGKSIPEPIELASKYVSTPTISYKVADETLYVEEYENEFYLDIGNEVEYTLIGNFTGKKVVIDNNNKKVDLVLSGVYYNNTTPGGDPFIEYNFNGSRVKLDNPENKLNYIYKASDYAIKSAKNINIVGKGDLILNSVFAPYGDLLIKGDGARIINTAATNNLIVGADPEDIEKGKVADLGKYKAQITVNNLAVNARNNKYGEPECGKVTANQYLVGSCTLGQVTDDDGVTSNIINLPGSKGEMTVSGGEVIVGNFQNTPEVFAGVNSLTKTGISTYTTYEVTNADVPAIEEDTSVWTVYRGDGYTKEEVNENFVTKAAYNEVVNELKAVRPVYAHFTVAEADKAKINKVHIHKYACPERFDDEPEGYKVSTGKLDTAVIMARDGDFGYHAIDGTGQINFTVEFNGDYQNGYVVIPVITPVIPADKPYSNFKSKYSTGLNCPLGNTYDYAGLITDGIYRITKVTTDLNVELHVYKESELPAHTITYNIINEDEVNAVVTTYKCVDGIEKVAKYGVYDSTQAVSELNPKNGYPKEFQNILVFENGTATEYTYDDGSGFKSNATYSDGSAGLQFTVTGLPEGYKATAEIFGGVAKTDYSKFEYSTDFGGYFAANKVGKDLTVTITISDAVNVQTIQPEGAYEFSDDVPTTASKSAPQGFSFDVYYNLDKSNNNDNHQLLPDPATLLDRIASITVDGVELTKGVDYIINAIPYGPEANKWQTYSVGTKPNKVEYYILSDGSSVAVTEATEEQLEMRVPKYISGLSGKKVTITIVHAAITGDIVITTAIPE